MKKTISTLLAVLMVLSAFMIAPVASNAEAASVSVELISKGSMWHCYQTEYYETMEEGAPSESWTTDSAFLEWEELEAPFGDQLYKPCPDTKTTFPTAFSAYLVKTFTVSNKDSVDTLLMDIFYDQNPQVYLNGELAWSTTGWTGGYVSVSLDPSLLVTGLNTIAVYFCNDPYGGGAAMDLSLKATKINSLITKAATWNYVTYEASKEIGSIANSLPLPEDWQYDLGLLTEDWFDDKTVVSGETEYDLSEHIGNYRSDTAQAPIGGNYWNKPIVNTATDYQYYLGYMNYTFNLDDPSTVGKLYMDVIYDEDPTVYINGQKVWSDIGYKDVAYNTVNLTAFRYLLVPGENVVSVSWNNHNGGAIMDLSLYYEDAVENDVPVIASCYGFSNFGDVNAATNMVDGDDNSCCGSGLTDDMDCAWLFTLTKKTYIEEVYIQSKNEGSTTDPDGSYGKFDVYALVNDEYQLIASDVPAYVGDGNGMKVAVGVSTTQIKVVPTAWYGNNWANISEFKAYPGENPVESEWLAIGENEILAGATYQFMAGWTGKYTFAVIGAGEYELTDGIGYPIEGDEVELIMGECVYLTVSGKGSVMVIIYYEEPNTELEINEDVSLSIGENEVYAGWGYQLIAGYVGTYTFNIIGTGDYYIIDGLGNEVENDTVVTSAKGESIYVYIRGKGSVQVIVLFEEVEDPNKIYVEADFNGDGELNISDVTALLGYLADTSTVLADTSNPDLNGSGECDIGDVTTLLNILSNMK